jgi:ABC-type multidrug transport system ATPase subunit
MGKTKIIEVLKNISGYANPGQTLYIMGSSGAGKTSLMNALSDRININKSNIVTGNVMVND